MNPYLDKLSFPQLLKLFLETTREFLAALEKDRCLKDINKIREKIKTISRVIEGKRSQLRSAV
jgi:hypothetical protein